MTDFALPGSIEPAVKRPNLDKGFNPLTMILFGGILGGRIAVRRLQPVHRHSCDRYSDNFLRALPLAVRCPAHRARLRVRQRLPRYRQRGRHGHLHPFIAGGSRRAVVGFLQFPRGRAFKRCGCVRDHIVASGRTHPPGRQQRRFRHGLRAADRGDHLESRHLVAGPAGVEFPHHDRLDHRRRRRQRAVARAGRHLRGRLGQGHRNRRGAPVLSDRGFRFVRALLSS